MLRAEDSQSAKAIEKGELTGKARTIEITSKQHAILGNCTSALVFVIRPGDTRD